MQDTRGGDDSAQNAETPEDLIIPLDNQNPAPSVEQDGTPANDANPVAGGKLTLFDALMNAGYSEDDE